MPQIVLLSIKPEFAEKILDGRKRFEFRRTIFRDTNVKKAIIYATRPVCRLIGEFEIEEVLSLPMDALWRRTRWEAGITHRLFCSYFCGKEECHAIKVANPTRYDEPMRLDDVLDMVRPPRSFKYIREYIISE
jgi:predicted transcriptional regulator